MFPPQDLSLAVSSAWHALPPGVYLAQSFTPFRSLFSHLSETSVLTRHTLPIPLSCVSSLACITHYIFCTDCQFHENKDFRMSSLCLYPRHWNGDWHLVDFQPPSAKRMKGVCAQKCSVTGVTDHVSLVQVCDRAVDSRQGFWMDPLAALPPRPPPRDMQMPEGSSGQ